MPHYIYIFYLCLAFIELDYEPADLTMHPPPKKNY